MQHYNRVGSSIDETSDLVLLEIQKLKREASAQKEKVSHSVDIPEGSLYGMQ